MTVSSSAPRKAGPYAGNGTAIDFAFSFKIFKKQDVQVTLTDPNGIDAVLTLDSDYSVTVNSNQDNNPGGSIRYPRTGSPAMPASYKLTVVGALPETQPTDLPNQGPYFGSVVMAAFDRAVILIQQLSEKVGRSLKFPVSESGASATLPAAGLRARKAVVFDDNGNVSVSGDDYQDQLANVTAQANAAAQSATNAGTSETMAQNWATKIGAAVVSGFYSAKEWAVGTFTRGSAGGGSAKDWATYLGGTVDDTDYSAKKQALDAAAAAASALANLNDFKGRWYGALPSDPATDPLGNPVSEGDAYGNYMMSPPRVRIFLNGAWMSAFVFSDATSISYQLGVAGSISRTVDDKLRERVSIKDFGAICDGNSHPLSTRFATLAAAQAQYPSATSLTDEIDSVAVQTALDLLQSNATLEFVGKPYSNKILYLNAAGKENVAIDARRAKLLVAGGQQYALIVHGATVDRTLTGAAWVNQFLSQPYEGVVTAKRVSIGGLTVSSASGSRVGTQVMFYFTDDAEADITVKNSNGNGVEFRHCVRPKYSRISVEDFANYGLFVYQCYGLKGGDLAVSNGGRAFEIKQRHKFYTALNHVMNNVEMTDLVGLTGDPAWATGGQSYNEQVRAGASSDIIANRNFAGHEISGDVVIRKISGVVSASASGSVTNPSVQIGCFANAWRINGIELDANGLTASTQPLNIGARGDITAGQVGGATFGENHEIGDVVMNNFQIADDTPLVIYGVSGSVKRFRARNCTVSKLLTQLTPTASLPLGTVRQFEFRDYDIDVNLKLGPANTRGVVIPSDTQCFVSGSAQGKLRVTPVNYASENTCNPWYVQAPVWTAIGRDEVEVASGGGGASNHTTTYGMMTTSTSGRIRAKVTVTAPATAQAIYLAATGSTKALTLDPCEMVLTGSPSGGKIALTTAGPVNMVGSHIYTGSWSTTLSDSSGKNLGQTIAGVDFGTAPPTTGTWPLGWVRWNSASALGQPEGWRCIASGTPGSWLSMGNL